ncbi:hypothetical protein INT44_006806 [Umbelopsis vinacea]|uniref:Uncharacterized protein n=1 Tax=Umbelopsis vinacea TaxID=44442 RepID=A0A8H7PIG1_9FUNG|nr:hypothetical protein INT44_006806 [Umbelopsis vinacea]
MNTFEPRTLYSSTTYPISPPYEFNDIQLFDHTLLSQQPKTNTESDKPNKIAWMLSPESSRCDDDFSETSSDSEKSLIDGPLDDVESLSVPSKMRYKHQDAVTAIMNSNSHIPLKSAVAIANGLGRYGRKSTPHRSPTASQVQEKDLIFQVDMLTPNGIEHKAKLISGESLLMALKRRVTAARHQDRSPSPMPHSKRMHQSRRMSVTRIWLPKTPSPSIQKKNHPRTTRHLEYPSAQPHMQSTRSPSHEPIYDEDSSMDSESDTKPRERQPTGQFKPHGSTLKTTRPKGPCQACQEHSEGCMRKAFGWPLTDGKIYYDKGRPFVYLCNKCGLRYNKSNGCVCRNCKWVLCKEDKRKAMHFIEAMRAKRPDGYLDPEEEIEGFLCPPKYWKCNQPWKVGWVLSTNTKE